MLKTAVNSALSRLLRLPLAFGQIPVAFALFRASSRPEAGSASPTNCMLEEQTSFQAHFVRHSNLFVLPVCSVRTSCVFVSRSVVEQVPLLRSFLTHNLFAETSISKLISAQSSNKMLMFVVVCHSRGVRGVSNPPYPPLRLRQAQPSPSSA